MDNEFFFSVDNMYELAHIDKHLNYLDSLIEKYKCTDFAKDEIKSIPIGWSDTCKQLAQIRSKRKDKKINISVIGEFSTGKSTFINALLGKELLESSALQGTTVASTTIEYDTNYIIELDYLDKRSKERRAFSSFDRLKASLKKCTTTDSTIAKELKAVHVYLPLDTLRGNFRVIDTPGTNVTEAWHEEVTIRTIREQSDLSIILLSAEKQLTETTKNFVNSYLMDILPQCIFVVTKIDLVRSRERCTVLKYLGSKIQDEFSLKAPVMLPFASLLFLEQGGNYYRDTMPVYDENDFSDSTLLMHSFHSLQMIMQHTEREKTVAITKKITALLEKCYGILSDNIEFMEDEYKKKLEFLNKSRKIDLSEYVTTAKRLGLLSFDKKTRSINNEIENEIDNDICVQISWLIRRLDDCESVDKLKDYIDQMLASECATCASKVLEKMEQYYKKLQNAFKTEMEQFNSSFIYVYDTLSIEPLNLEKKNYAMPEKVQVQTANLDITAQYIAKALSEENVSFWGGTAAGAAIGTVIFPGVGTLIGGFAGMIFGAAKMPDTNDVRSKCKDKLRSQLNCYFMSVSASMKDTLDKYLRQIRQSLIKEMDGYIPRYKREVDHMILQVEGEKSGVFQKTEELSKDKKVLLIHKKQLESVIVHLNQIGRKDWLK